MSLSFEELKELIRSQSERIKFVKKYKYKKRKPDIFQIEFDGNRIPNFVYCKKCNLLLRNLVGTSGNIIKHCKTLNHSIQQPKDVDNSANLIGKNKHLVNFEEKLTSAIKYSKKQEYVLPATPLSNSRAIDYYFLNGILMKEF